MVQSFFDQRAVSEAQPQQLATSVEQLAAERQSQQPEALELELQNLRLQLDAMYGYRSWRMTVLFRHLSLLVGRIAR